VVMVFEDVHWIDPTSLELLDLTVDHIRSLPVLLIVTIRIPKSSPQAGSELHLSSDDVAGEVSRVFSEPVPSSRRMYPLPSPSSYHPR
jgi:hypothetical protein